MPDNVTSQHEYYIRQPSDTEAHGPFTLEQLAQLAGSGGLNFSTFYFDANADQWLPISHAPRLVALLPESARRVSVSARPLASTLAVALLAAGALSVLLSASGIPGGFDSDAFLRHPCLWIGALDFLLALCCVAFGSRFFRFVRIRAGLGAGFLGTLFWMQADTGALLAALAASVCLWLATTLASTRALAGNAIAGLAALVVLAYCLFP